MIGIPLLIIAAVTANVDSLTTSHKEDTHISLNEKERYFAIKTNFVPWAAGILNAACEIQIGSSLSVALPVWWSPYFVSNKYSLRTLFIQPEVRYWLKTPGCGHFFGLHPGIAWYNLKYKDIRYQDTETPLINVGISYGYTLKLNDHLNAEFSLGIGYAKTKYDRFYNINNGAKIDSRQTSYLGIDRIELTLVYHFDL